MSPYPHLENAPITEALIDFRVKVSSKVDVNKLSEAHEAIKEKYPKAQQRYSKQFVLQIDDSEGPQTVNQDTKFDKIAFSTSDEKKVVQFGVAGFTFSWLKPYSNWEELRDEAKSLWNLYKEIAAPETITRIALRYINRLELPGPLLDFDDYLIAGPQVPEALPQGVSNFFSRVVIHEPSHNFSANIIHVFEGIPNPEKIPIILDIDVYKTGEFNIENDDYWDNLELLRNFKNDIFFNSLTDKAIEVFK